MIEANFHGEVVIKRKKGNIPQGATKVKAVSNQYKIADSETTGNHHLLEANPNLEMYEKDGVFYVKSSNDIVVSCVDKSRHDTQTLEPTKEDEILVIHPAQEYDYLAQEKRNVAD